MAKDLEAQMVFESKRKSIGLAYLLWLLLGAFGVHRFYSGRTGSGIAQLILSLTGVGLLIVIPWLLIDLFLIPGMVNEKNMETIRLLNHGTDTRIASEPQPAHGQTPRQAVPRKSNPRGDLSAADRRREEMLEDLRKTGYKKERRDNSDLYR